MKRLVIEILQKLGLLKTFFRIHELIRRANPRVMFRNARYLGRMAPDGMPIPPLRLIVLVAGNADISSFLQGGKLAVRSITDTLEKNGLDIKDFQAILDFGCGCGRVTRYWHSLPTTAVFGTDYNRELVEWCKQHLTFAEFATNSLSPPLAFDEGGFDFVYALSVFTHLPESLQTAWIDELARVLRPGGYLLMTTHGERYMDILTPDEKETFAAGQLVVRYEKVAGTNMCSAFHPQKYVREKLTYDFEVVDFVAGGARGNLHQDIFLLRKTRR